MEIFRSFSAADYNPPVLCVMVAAQRTLVRPTYGNYLNMWLPGWPALGQFERCESHGHGEIIFLSVSRSDVDAATRCASLASPNARALDAELAGPTAPPS